MHGGSWVYERPVRDLAGQVLGAGGGNDTGRSPLAAWWHTVGTWCVSLRDVWRTAEVGACKDLRDHSGDWWFD